MYIESCTQVKMKLKSYDPKSYKKNSFLHNVVSNDKLKTSKVTINTYIYWPLHHLSINCVNVRK